MTPEGYVLVRRSAHLQLHDEALLVALEPREDLQHGVTAWKLQSWVVQLLAVNMGLPFIGTSVSGLPDKGEAMDAFREGARGRGGGRG